MNKTTMLSISINKITLAIIAFLAITAGGLTSANEQALPPAQNILTAGDQSGLYMILFREVQGKEGFNIYYREKLGARFLSSSWYQGKPINAELFNRRLHLFFANGNSMSYTLLDNQTEKRIPADYELISSTASDSHLLALVKPKASDAKSDDPNAPLNKALVILTRQANTDWEVSHSLSTKSMPYPLPDSSLKLISYNNQSLLFGLFDSKIFKFDINDKKPPTLINDQFINLVDIIPIIVNHELYITAVQAHNDIHLMLHPYSDDDTTLTFNTTLKGNDQTITTFDEKSFSITTFGKNIALFDYKSPVDILWAEYSPSGQQLSKFAKIPALQYKSPHWLSKIDKYFIFPLLLSFYILYLHRREAFDKSQQLLPHIQVAPFITRLIAFIFDLFIILTLSEVYVQISGITIPAELSNGSYSTTLLMEQIQRGTIPPHIIKYFMISLSITYIITIIYYIAFEIALSATPGKFFMNMVITNFEGKKPTIKQILIRNITRFCLIEFYPIILFTHHRQRIGDLMAKTIVATKIVTIPRDKNNQNSSKGDNFDEYDNL